MAIHVERMIQRRFDRITAECEAWARSRVHVMMHGDGTENSSGLLSLITDSPTVLTCPTLSPPSCATSAIMLSRVV